MRRTVMLILCVCLIAPALLAAQEAPPPAATPDPLAQPGDLAAPDEAAPLPAEPAPPSSPIPADALPVLINARTDLELLAIQYLGSERPPGWSGNLDIGNPQLPLYIRLDLELLAGTLIRPDQRPPGWFGAVPSTSYAIARDIRHDLELLADALGQPNIRPLGWTGDDPLMRCERPVQALVQLLERTGAFVLTADPALSNFCQQAGIQASQFAETALLNSQNPARALVASPGQPEAPTGQQVSTNFAVAFLDRFGSQQVGTIPLGEPVTPTARSYRQFSKMVLVRGAGFEVFADYETIGLSADQFAALPDVDSLGANPTCSAAWCKAPQGR
mgnify:FL=1